MERLGSIDVNGSEAELTTENVSLWLHIPKFEVIDHVFLRPEVDKRILSVRLFRYIGKHALLFNNLREQMEELTEAEKHLNLRRPDPSDLKAYQFAREQELDDDLESLTND